jgi:hypothetical protein
VIREKEFGISLPPKNDIFVCGRFESNGGLLGGLLALLNGQTEGSTNNPSAPRRTPGDQSATPTAPPGLWGRGASLWGGGSGSSGGADNSGVSQPPSRAVAAPYRGAYGYAPFAEGSLRSFQGYSSPYALMDELVTTQLRASVRQNKKLGNEQLAPSGTRFVLALCWCRNECFRLSVR